MINLTNKNQKIYNVYKNFMNKFRFSEQNDQRAPLMPVCVNESVVVIAPMNGKQDGLFQFWKIYGFN